MRSERRRLLVVPFVLLFLVAARQRPVTRPTVHELVPHDVYSYAEPNRVKIRHLDLDLDVDFDAQMLRGKATLTIDNFGNATTLALDTRDLQIESVEVDGRATQWQLGMEMAIGTRLAVPITSATRSVAISYSTGQNAEALTWTPPQQTLGRTMPYLFSQNEPDSARSWIPLQDTPAVRMTYTARVRVPSGMLALMSAENPVALEADNEYEFRMPEPIPSYLVAIAVGRIAFHPLDERSGVYAEPELLDDAAWDLQHIPAMIDAAEEIVDVPYPFERYDVLLMPPIYPLGGMEHPRLNFINPFSVVTGNHPRMPLPSSLIAHELAHSWAGDMTTLATWEDVWLNEGITSYLAQRILEEMAGTERVEHAYFLDRRNFENYVRNPPSPSVTILHRGYVKDESPDERFDTTQYTKGELFIRTLEDELGRPAFDDFLRSYFAEYAFRWVDDRNFLASLQRKGLAHERLRLQEWIYQPGLPSNVSAPTTSRIYTRVQAEASAFASGRAARLLSTAGWTDIEMELFLNLAASAVRSRMAEVDSAFSLTARETPPLWWLLNGIYSRYSPIYSVVERVLLRGGTNSRMVTLYSALMNNSDGRQFAARVFAEARDRYHPATAAQIEQILREHGLAGYEEAA